jgi:pilus assembly protein CpaF
MNKYASVKTIISIVIGFAIFIFGVIYSSSNLSLFLHGARTNATVSIGLADKPYLAFSDQLGNSYIKPLENVFSNTLKDKESVPIIFNPSNPNNLNVNSPLFLWAINFSIIFIGMITILFGVMSLNWTAINQFISGVPVESIQSNKIDNFSNQSNSNTQQSTSTSSFAEFDSSIFGPIRKLIEDPEISDIILESSNGIFFKKSSKIIKSDVVFPSKAQYTQFIERILSQSDNSLTIAKPIVDGMINPWIRMHAVHEVLCEKGPYVTLRISRQNNIKYQDLLNSTMAPREISSYLRSILLTGNTILIAGEVGTGKTTLIRGLAATIPERESILVIEDTPEIKIEHPVVRYVRTRASNVEGVGKVSPGECIKAGMRMAMNRIIFGEIRDPEAAESFIDVCVSGHPGMSTVHARSAKDAVARLELLLARQQPGVERFALREQIGAAVQVIVHTFMCTETNKRRVDEVIEVRPGTGDNPIETQTIFTYIVANKMPCWKVENRKSFFAEALKDFEGGNSLLVNLPDYITLGK